MSAEGPGPRATAAKAASSVELLRFAVFELDVGTHELWKSGRHVQLALQPAKLLVALALRAGELVTRTELRNALWAEDTFVDFAQGLNFCIRRIRAALGDDARCPRFIETLPRRGYRFVAPVERLRPREAAVAPDLAASLSGPSSPDGASAVVARSVIATGPIARAERFAQRTIASETQRWALGVSFIAVTLIAGVLSYLFLSRREKTPHIVNPTQVTSALGADAYPTWSPEGRRLAYHLDPFTDFRNFDIWVTQIGGGPPVNLTQDHSGNDRWPSWSPDGRLIAFCSDREGGGYFVMPALGGAPRKVLDVGEEVFEATRSQWSSDGKRLASVVYDKGLPYLAMVSLETGDSRRWALPGRTGYSRMDLAGSPDGRYFAYVDARDYSSQVGQIFVYDIEEAKGEAVTEGYASVWSPSWSSDGSYLYFVSNRGGSMDLWQRRMRGRKPVGDPQPLTTGVGITSASFSPDGTRLAYSKGTLVSNVWRIPILSDRPATWADAQQITFDEVYVEMLDVSPDGRRLIISSDRAGNPDLWILSVEGGEMEQVTTDPTPDWAPRWSPDGEQVAFYSYRSGNREIWVQPLRGGAARQVTKGEAESAFPTWSPDGREIAFLSFSSGNRHLWALPATGGSARQITRPPADDFEPSWSPNGKALAFFSTRSGAMNLWRVPADGGEPKQVSEEEGWVPRWSPDGKWIYFVGEGENTGNLWSIPADGGRARPLTDLSGRRGSILGSALAADGRYIYFAWQEGLADIWAANVEYP